jgi:hypothetical protein
LSTHQFLFQHLATQKMIFPASRVNAAKSSFLIAFVPCSLPHTLLSSRYPHHPLHDRLRDPRFQTLGVALAVAHDIGHQTSVITVWILPAAMISPVPPPPVTPGRSSASQFMQVFISLQSLTGKEAT